MSSLFDGQLVLFIASELRHVWTLVEMHLDVLSTRRGRAGIGAI